MDAKLGDRRTGGDATPPPDWDIVFARARDAIKANPESFAEAARWLDEVYTLDEAHESIGPSVDSPNADPRLARLSVALQDALRFDHRAGKGARYGALDFGARAPRAEREQAARRFVLIVLLGGDPEAHEAINPAWGELAGYPWEIDGGLGRGFLSWPDEDAEILGRLGEAVALLKATGEAGTTDPLPIVEHSDPEAADTSHSPDFASVNWYGTRYMFSKGNQSEAVRALWEAWENGGHALKQETIAERIGSSGSSNFRLDHTFRKRSGDGKYETHPAWGTMIVSEGKGCHRLAEPEKK